MTKTPARTGTLQGWTTSSFTHGADTKTVWKKGTGPGVIVIAEMPGNTPAVIGFADRVVDAGFTVVMPHLFGTPEREVSVPYVLNSIVKGCISKEMTSWALQTTSPVTVWLGALAASLHEECGGPGVGAIGMCFTGGFALGMMVHGPVVAPVLSQPSLPFALGKARRRDVNLASDDLAKVKQIVADGCPVMGLRFTHDPAVPVERFDRLRQELGDGFIAIELDSSKGNPYGHRRGAHSVVTEDLDDQPGTPTRDALDRVMAFFAERLKA